MLKVQTHFCKYKGAKIQEKQYGASDFKTIRLSNIQTFWNLIPNLICFYLGSRISYRKVFVLQTKLWIPPFQRIMSQLSSMSLARDIKHKLWGPFFWLTLYIATCQPIVLELIIAELEDTRASKNHNLPCILVYWIQEQFQFGYFSIVASRKYIYSFFYLPTINRRLFNKHWKKGYY